MRSIRNYLQTQTTKEQQRPNERPAVTHKLPVTVESIAPVIKDISRDIEYLKRKVRELESRPKLAYIGVFKEGRSYEAGCFVTHSGAIWYCNQATTTPPGNGAAAWTLACKGVSR